MAWLDWSASVMPPEPEAAAGLSGLVEAYRSSRALTPDPLPDIAMPNAIRRIARAATTAMTMVMSTSWSPRPG